MKILVANLFPSLVKGMAQATKEEPLSEGKKLFRSAVKRVRNERRARAAGAKVALAPLVSPPTSVLKKGGDALVMVALVVSFLAAASAAAADARRQLDAFAEGLQTLSARFQQITRDETGRVVDETSGTLVFSAPDRFRWDYLEPFPQVLLANGEELWHYDESLEQVTVQAQPAPEDSPMMVLTDPGLLDRFYEIEPGRSAEILELRPLSDESDFESARLYFLRGLPERLELVDNFGQRTTLILSDIERNPELDEALFSFEVPDGVDVLKGME